MKQSFGKMSTNLSLKFLHNTKKLVHSFTELEEEEVLNHSVEIDDEGSEDSAGSQELLRMEVKQLKRENAFLKGKIEELKRGVIQQVTPVLLKRQSITCTNILKKRPDLKATTQQHSLNFILTQINSILNSLASLYKVQIPEKRWPTTITTTTTSRFFNSNRNKINNNSSSRQQLHVKQQTREQYKWDLNRRLERVALEKYQKRYESVLGIFLEYYRMKTVEEEKTAEKIQTFIQHTIEISKQLVERAAYKAQQKTLRTSCIYSVQCQESLQVQNHNNNVNINSDFVPNISLKDSFIFGDKQKLFGGKHKLSYSTIDGRNPFEMQTQ